MFSAGAVFWITGATDGVSSGSENGAGVGAAEGFVWDTAGGVGGALGLRRHA